MARVTPPEMRLNVDEVVRLRQRQGLSSQALAKKAGVSQSGLSEIEAGKTNPRPSTILKLAAALNVELDRIVEWR
jgi:transcriptional regulator with XRE-family HTH domain